MERGTTAWTTTLATLSEKGGSLERLFSRKDKNALVVVGAAAISASSAMMLCYFAYKKSSSNSSGKNLKKKDFVKAMDDSTRKVATSEKPTGLGRRRWQVEENRFDWRFGENVGGMRGTR